MSRYGKLRTLDMWGLRKGVFYDRHLLEIPPGGAYDSLNVVNYNGFLRQRPGTEVVLRDPDLDTIGQEDVPIRHLSQFVNFDNERFLVKLIAPNTDANPTDSIAFRLHDGTGWAYNVSTTVAGSGVWGRIPASSVNFKGEFFINNFQTDDDIHVWSGGPFTESLHFKQINPQLRAPKGAQFLAAHPDCLIVANVRDQSNIRRAYRVSWSSKLDATTWRNENSSDVGSGTSGYVDLAEESDPITALWASGDIILAFKARVIYQGEFVGPPLGYRFTKPFSIGAGCVSHHTLREYRDGILVWLGDDNVYIGSPGKIPQPVGVPIQPAIRNMADLSRMDRAVGIIDPDYPFYHLFLPNNVNGKVDLLFSLNMVDYSWWRGSLAGSGLDVRTAMSYRESTWDNHILLGGDDGKIRRFGMSIVGDEEESFPAYWQSGVVAVDNYIQGVEQGSVQQLRAYAFSGSVGLSSIQGDGIDRLLPYPFGNQVFDGLSSLDTSRRPYKGEHAMVRVDWIDDETQIAGLSIGVIPEGATRGRR